MHPHSLQHRLAPWLFGLIALVCAAAASAHSGHDHGGGIAAPPPDAEPRFTAAGAAITVVGILKSSRLWLYADDAGSNAPLDGLRIDVDVDGNILHAERAAGAGAYVVAADALNIAGDHPLVITVADDSRVELLTATLAVPAADPAVHAGPAGDWEIAVLPLLAGGLVLYLAWRRNRSARSGFATAVALGTIGLCCVLLSGAYAVYVTTSTAAALVDIPDGPAGEALDSLPDTRARRMADGAVFLPKPAQSLLQLRTVTVHTQRLPRSLTLSGRIVHDPHSRIAVQAAQAGRLAPPPAGFPLPGARVKKGELLAFLQPVVSALEGARQQAELTALEKDLYLNRRQTERIREQLGTEDNSASVALDVGRAEQAALQKRIDLLRNALTAPLPMRAPADGVIGESNALHGAVIPAGGQVFSIVDPTRFRMQALAAPDLDTQRIHSAYAVLHDGRRFPLAFAGHGFQLDNQALPLQFRPLADMPALLIGALIDIRLQTHESLEGVPVPHTALLPAPAGDGAQVWVRTQAERFEPRRVRTQPADEQQVLVVSGLQAGERVITNGASLLSMVQY